MTTTDPGRAGDPTAKTRALNWSERQAVDELVGALTSVAGLIAHRPDTTRQVWATVIDQLGDAERKLITALEWEMVRRNVAEMKAEGSFPVADDPETDSDGEQTEGQERSEEMCPHCGRTSHGFACSQSMGVREASDV